MNEISLSSRSQRETRKKRPAFLYNMLSLYAHVMIGLDPQQGTSLREEEVKPQTRKYSYSFYHSVS
jgi:hypothetical protein